MDMNQWKVLKTGRCTAHSGLNDYTPVPNLYLNVTCINIRMYIIKNLISITSVWKKGCLNDKFYYKYIWYQTSRWIWPQCTETLFHYSGSLLFSFWSLRTTEDWDPVTDRSPTEIQKDQKLPERRCRRSSRTGRLFHELRDQSSPE